MKPAIKSRLTPGQNSRAVANSTLEAKAEEGSAPQSTRLKIGKSDDAFEKEADHIADLVVNKKSAVHQQGFETPQVAQLKGDEEQGQAKMEIAQRAEEEEAQSKPETAQLMGGEEEAQSKEEEDKAQTKAESGARKASASLKTTNTVKATKGGGSPLGEGPKQFMEKGFGADFSSVRIHTDDKAQDMSRELGAQAFTVGQDIYFNKGRFNLETQSGKQLLAHELTHTIQQKVKKG